VKETFAHLSQFADIVIVSATPHEAIVREWGAQGLLENITVVAGQELGTKKDCIRKAAEGKYDPSCVLMVGDAPGDYEAAKSNNALFYPIIPGDEVNSWKKLKEVVSQQFKTGTYAGAAMQEALDAFDSVLQEEPNW
jgi:phosphoglycolate phosphatase-like HAD superfamily hydrolase